MTIVKARAGGAAVLVGRPDGSSEGALSLDIVEVLARAKASAAAACILPPSWLVNHALFALTSDEVRRVDPAGLRGRWLRARWQAAARASAVSGRTTAAAATFWREIYRELRRHIGDERLPYPLRTRLRAMADRSLECFARADRLSAPAPFPRRLFRERIATRLPPEMLTAAESAAAMHGIPVEGPLVALELRSRPEFVRDATDALVADGYTVVRLGEPGPGPVARAGIVDLAMSPRSPILEVFVLLKAAFAMCESADVQQAAYLTNTPCLRLNAIDPFEAYPVRDDGLFTLASPIDLSTGRALEIAEALDPGYQRHLRRYGHRPNRPHEILAAVREMQEVVRGVRTDSEGQARYRAHVVEAGRALGAHEPWGPDEGFIGDGRLARVQADRAV